MALDLNCDPCLMSNENTSLGEKRIFKVHVFDGAIKLHSFRCIHEGSKRMSLPAEWEEDGN